MMYKRKTNAEFNAKLAPKPFPPSPRKEVVVTIEDGKLTFLKTDSADVFLELGEVITKRASHVEPGPRYERWFFHILRRLFGETGRVADWTRSWNTLWRVNTKPVGGPILAWGDVLSNCPSCMVRDTYYECDRQRAVDAEIIFLNKFFVERGIR